MPRVEVWICDRIALHPAESNQSHVWVAGDYLADDLNAVVWVGVSIPAGLFLCDDGCVRGAVGRTKMVSDGWKFPFSK